MNRQCRSCSSAGRREKAEFYHVGGMAWGPDKALYVADDSAIRRVKPDGTVTTLTRKLYEQVTGDSDPGHPISPRGLAVGDDGSVYVAVEPLGRITRVKPDGELSVAARFEDKWQPEGVALRDGRLYATEVKWIITKLEGPRLRVFEPDGTSRIMADLSEFAKYPRALRGIHGTSVN